MLTIPTRDTLLAATLSIASLALWFALGFPWEHHNESLVWAVEMEKIPFAATLLSNPITPVQTWRPLGVAMAWLGLHLTHGGIWLQQIVNFLLTAVAWLIAARATEQRLGYAWLSFLANAGFFSGYIYLFHLHGVFYGPLFIFLALLLVRDRETLSLSWGVAFTLFLLAMLAALFHTFALLFFAAWIAGRWLENRLKGREANLAAAITAIVFAAIVTKLLVSQSNDLGQGSPLLGLIVSYRALELKPALALLSILLAALAASTAPGSPRVRILRALGGALFGLLLVAMQLPAIFAWIAICAARAAFSGRWTLAGLIAITALLPVATATGSPTYALFVLMPCIIASLDGLTLREPMIALLRRGGYVAVLASFALLVALKLDMSVPVVGKLVEPLLAEREKTQQLKTFFGWLDSQTALSGDMKLCQPGDFPTRSNGALDRRHRAPTHAWPFGEYLKARYGDRLLQPAGPQLRLCFGGEEIAGAETLYSADGARAGEVVLYRVASTSQD